MALRKSASAYQHLSGFVRIGLHQNGNVEPRHAEAVGDAAFIAEVGQSHQNGIDLVAILLEQFRALACILQSLNSNQCRPPRSRFE